MSRQLFSNKTGFGIYQIENNYGTSAISLRC